MKKIHWSTETTYPLTLTRMPAKRKAPKYESKKIRFSHHKKRKVAPAPETCAVVRVLNANGVNQTDTTSYLVLWWTGEETWEPASVMLEDIPEHIWDFWFQNEDVDSLIPRLIEENLRLHEQRDEDSDATVVLLDEDDDDDDDDDDNDFEAPIEPSSVQRLAPTSSLARAQRLARADGIELSQSLSSSSSSSALLAEENDEEDEVLRLEAREIARLLAHYRRMRAEEASGEETD